MVEQIPKGCICMGLGIADGIDIEKFESRVYSSTALETMRSYILIITVEEKGFDNYTENSESLTI